MKLRQRTRPSCFMITKGAMVEATFAAFKGWDMNMSLSGNIKRIRNTNYIGAPSGSWLRDFGKVLSRRFEPDGRDKALVELARNGCAIDGWKPLLLWHVARSDSLVYDFFTVWLYQQFCDGIQQLRSEQFRSYLGIYHDQYVHSENAWSEANLKSSAGGLARMPVDFGILRGKRVKEFTSYTLPEQSFIYLLHAIMEQENNAKGVIDCADWRLFMMSARDVETELYRLHQYREVQFEIAGSLAQLKLPCKSASEYARRMV